MSRIVKSSCTYCRRENVKLFLKGDRCYTDKCSFERRPYPPGQHGQSRLKFSEFALQLREKQKTKRYYGIFEKQFRKYFHIADRQKGVTGLNLLRLLESRMDNVIYTMGFAGSRREAKTLISHNHFKVNGKRVNVPSYILKKGDIVEVDEKSREIVKILSAMESSKNRETPSWIELDHGNFKGTVADLLEREHVTLPVEENMIVEFYSR